MSTRDVVLAYLRERMRPRVFVPLALLCALTGWMLVPGSAFDASVFFLAAAHAFVFSLAFRVWDDLEDRNADRIRHPHRVMARSTRTAPFLWLVALLAVAGMTSFLQLNDPLPRAIAIATAVAALSIWYSARRSENWNHVAGEHIVLAKYPAIAFATAPTIPDASSFVRTSVVLAALYAVICIYEYIDDPELRHVFSSRRSLP
jgi:4-hydroxybenzoate polyprenyltransferase